MQTNMILSASGWRKVFAISGDEQDKTALIGDTNTAIAVYAATVFADFMTAQKKDERPSIIVGTDSRPTGQAIAEAVIKTLLSKNCNVHFTGIIAAPEIMAYARTADGFLYISASHNPVGHNGIKFGLNDGGVLNATQNALLVPQFEELCKKENAIDNAFMILKSVKEEDICTVYKKTEGEKQASLKAYDDFLRRSISGFTDKTEQNKFFEKIKEAASQKKLGIVCDMNGSARTLSVDKTFFEKAGLSFYAINDRPGLIAHEIIPEDNNLSFVAEELERLQKTGHKDALIGYMPDCDGDRGNIVYWNEELQKSVILRAQEVFALSVLSELSYTKTSIQQNAPLAVCVNCPTSMRIEEIAAKFDAKVFRSEVGEANVVNLAKEKREQGFCVPILGEGSNGGTITWPSSVRDPLNTVFAILKLLLLKEPLEYWLKKCSVPPKNNITLSEILKTIPVYTTTGVSDARAILKINEKDHAALKSRFQKFFTESYEQKKDELLQKYGIASFEAVITNGTKETCGVKDFSLSKKGGLKIKFYDKDKKPVAFMWMRGSGTEPVFRIMCDVQGKKLEAEQFLIAWETELLQKADCC